ncbi:hypothetical protein BASA62_005212 [Batrachochytrium salamandrivorans]|nr:hypothetical protein BASA62_005212 [Batrachochytrium salamandrivorans]
MPDSFAEEGRWRLRRYHRYSINIPKERPASKFNDPNEPKIPRSARGLPVQKPIAKYAHVIAVASGKGGCWEINYIG